MEGDAWGSAEAKVKLLVLGGLRLGKAIEPVTGGAVETEKIGMLGEGWGWKEIVTAQVEMETYRESESHGSLWL